MVDIDTDTGVLGVPDLGITLRTLLGCAVRGYASNPKRSWKIKYKEVVIGEIRIKTDGSLKVASSKIGQLKTTV